MGFLDSTSVCTHKQYLCTHVHADAIFAHACVFTRVHACIADVASSLPFSLSYNATILVTLFFPYRALATHQGVEEKIVEELESTSLIL